jgi:hypothetical protein
MTPEEREAHDLLVENIDTELRAQNALPNLGLDQPLIASLAKSIADNVDYVFRYSLRRESI